MGTYVVEKREAIPTGRPLTPFVHHGIMLIHTHTLNVLAINKFSGELGLMAHAYNPSS